MRLTPKGYPRDERPASLIDAPFSDAPSTGGICVRPYTGPRSRVCAEWGCRDSMRVAKRRERAGKEWSRRERLATCNARASLAARTPYPVLSWLVRGASRNAAEGVFKYEFDAEYAWDAEAQPAVLRSIAAALGQGLAADLILASRSCNHVRYCYACCDALRDVLRRPKAADLVSMATGSAA